MFSVIYKFYDFFYTKFLWNSATYMYMSILVVYEYMLNLYGLLLLYLLHVYWIICLCLGDLGTTPI